MHVIITTKARRAERDFEMWKEGADQTEAEFQEALDSKSEFIERQAGLLTELANTAGYINWGVLPDHLRDELANYV